MADTSAPLPSTMRGGKEPRHSSQGEVAALKEELANLQQLREQYCQPLIEFAPGGREFAEGGFN